MNEQRIREIVREELERREATKGNEEFICSFCSRPAIKLEAGDGLPICQSCLDATVKDNNKAKELGLIDDPISARTE